MASIAFVFLLLAQIAAPFQDPARIQLAPVPADSPARVKRIEVIRGLIEQLDSKEFSVRSGATKKLEKIACLELDLIKEAAATGSPEVKMRMRRLIEEFSKFSHILVDAVGNPIPGARVTIELADGKLELVSNGCGHLKLPESDRNELLHQRPKITVSHKDYGVALGDAFPSFPQILPGQPGPRKMTMNMISVPLVNRSSEARARGVNGKVLQADGEPVKNALVTCRMVRTPGMGMMQPGDAQTVFANEDGEFSLYLDQRRCQNRALPSKFIPPNSSYSLQVEDRDGEFFPWGGIRTNLETEPIVLKKPKRKFDVRFLNEAGKEVVKDIEIEAFHIQYRGPDCQCLLRGDFVKRGWLLPGTYTARRRPIPGQSRSAHSQKYETVTIKDDSSDEITFEVAKLREIQGTVVDAETGKPLAKAMVVTTPGAADRQLANLTDHQWAVLQESPAKFDEEAHSILVSIFGREMSATKTNEKGEFVISESKPGVMHSVVAFTPTTVPMRESLYCVDKHLKDGKGNPRFTLYPAAFVTVQPKVKSYARWVILQSKTPQLTELLKTAASNSNEQHAKYNSWLPSGEPAKLMVPANTKLQIKLFASEKKYSANLLPQEINLKPGEHLKFDPVEFKTRIPLAIRVVNQAGKPVEGVAVRVLRDGLYSLSVNTDVNGAAVRMVDRNSEGICRVGGLMFHSKIPDADTLKVKFSVGETAKEPLIVKMTQEQIDAILVKPNAMPGG